MKITLLAAFLLVAGIAGAQPNAPTGPSRPESARVEARLSSWLGCWRLEDDPEDAGARVCITPDDPGVRMVTIVAGQRAADEVLRGDGVARPIVETGCTGTERTEWSKDGLRLFRHADVTCDTAGSRSVSAILFLVPGPTWVDVEMVGSGDSRRLRVRRYRRATDRALPDDTRVTGDVGGGAAGPLTGTGTPWDVDDVIEASRRMPAELVQAALTEAGGRFALNKRSLTALADAGVPEHTIDLMIALTYLPDHFAVQRRGGSASTMGAISIGSGFYDPLFYWGSSYASCDSQRYGWQSTYGCGDDYDYWYDYGGEWVPPYPGTVPEAQPHGRVVNGQGYTQGQPPDSGPAPAGWSGWSVPVGVSGDASGVSPSGYSSSGDSGDRVSVPRTPDRR
jgi:hypothetical protein